MVVRAPNAARMRLLFFGDVVGPLAVAALSRHIPEWRSALRIDAVIANAENAVISRSDDPRVGFGMSAEAIEMLLEAGVDAVTGGNHSWDAPDAETALDNPRVVRPHNVYGTLPGKGIATIAVRGVDLTIVNLIGASAAGERYTVSNPLAAFDGLALPDANVIVDFHSESVTEKQTFAHAVDGRALAILGTHTHEPSSRLTRLPRGTVYATDVGMVGPDGGVQGIAPTYYVREMREFREPHHFELAAGELLLGAVLLDVGVGGAQTIERFTPTDWP